VKQGTGVRKGIALDVETVRGKLCVDELLNGGQMARATKRTPFSDNHLQTADDARAINIDFHGEFLNRYIGLSTKSGQRPCISRSFFLRVK
jgi:hypothetical protein